MGQFRDSLYDVESGRAIRSLVSRKHSESGPAPVATSENRQTNRHLPLGWKRSESETRRFCRLTPMGRPVGLEAVPK